MSRFRLVWLCLFWSAGWSAVAGAQDAGRWQASGFRAVNGTGSAWCGSPEVVSCTAWDQDGGYGRHYDEILEWRGHVADPRLPCTVSISALINLDTMPGYDYFFVSVGTAAQAHLDLVTLDGLASALPIATQFVYQPAEYAGPGGDEVVIRFRVTSDGGWDGDDCLWPNDGAVQVDNVSITLDNGIGYGHDFEDGTLGQLHVVYPNGAPAAVPVVGEFSVQARPNPFNPTTVLDYRAARPGRLSVSIYDVRGVRVRQLFDGLVSGDGGLSWDGRQDSGEPAATGIYHYVARLDGSLRTGKLTLLK